MVIDIESELAKIDRLIKVCEEEIQKYEELRTTDRYTGMGGDVYFAYDTYKYREVLEELNKQKQMLLTEPAKARRCVFPHGKLTIVCAPNIREFMCKHCDDVGKPLMEMKRGGLLKYLEPEHTQ